MSKDALWLAMLAAQFDAACSAMDAQRVPTRDRMVWPPDMQLPRMTWAPSAEFRALVAERKALEENEAITRAVAGAFSCGLGAYQIGRLDGDVHTLAIHPCELFDYPGQLRPLDAAIRGIFNRQMKGTQ